MSNMLAAADDKAPQTTRREECRGSAGVAHSPKRPPTLEEIREWPATVAVPLASSAFGYSRSYGYELAARDEFPARLIKRGRVTRVITASIIAALEETGDAEGAA